jgi:hypothetical protein
MNTTMDIETYMDMDTGDGHTVSIPGADIGKDVDPGHEHGH